MGHVLSQVIKKHVPINPRLMLLLDIDYFMLQNYKILCAQIGRKRLYWENLGVAFQGTSSMGDPATTSPGPLPEHPPPYKPWPTSEPGYSSRKTQTGLHQLGCHSVNFKKGKEAFENIRIALCTNAVLFAPLPNRPFCHYLYTDASNIGVGAVLTQETPTRE